MISQDFTIIEAEVLLRAAVLFKFGEDEDARIFAGSPYFSSSVTSLLNSIISKNEEEGNYRKAKAWRETYRLKQGTKKWHRVSLGLATHPEWESLSDTKRREWIRVLAAPYWLEEADLDKLSSGM